MSTTIQIRVDEDIKKKADITFKRMGLDVSSGIKLFLHQVIRSGSIPFMVRTANGFTPAKEKKILRETAQAIKKGKSYTSVKELFDDILDE